MTVLALATSRTAVTRLDDGSFSHTVIDPVDALVYLSLSTDGILSVTGDIPTSYSYLTGDSPANWEVRFTATVGTVSTSTGAMATWLPLSIEQAISVSRAIIGSKAATITVEIGKLGTATVLDTATIPLTATVEAA